MRKKMRKVVPETEEVAAEEQAQKQKRKKSSNNSIVTKESFCAVFALFSLLSLFILITGEAIFGEPGGYMRALLLGLFGYMAYPVTALAGYNCVMGFLELKLFRKRKWVLLLLTTALFGALVAHTVQTYFILGYPSESYLSTCFNAGEAFSSCTIFGFTGGLIANALASVTTKIGALVILSAICLLSCYVLVRPLFRSLQGIIRMPREPRVKQQKQPKEAESAPVQNAVAGQPQENAYGQPYGEASTYPTYREAPVYRDTPIYRDAPTTQQSIPERTVATEPIQPAQPVQALEGYSESGVDPKSMGGYTPFMPYTVRRPGFTMSSDANASANTGQAVGDKPMQEGVDSGYSPFGATSHKQEMGRPISPEESRRILFGSTPAQNYHDNLIFDGNANVNRRNAVSSPAPTIAPAPNTATYSEQYTQSMQDPTPPRPRMVVGDSGENFGRKSSNPYGLDVPNDSSRAQSYRSDSERSSRAVANTESSTSTYGTSRDVASGYRGTENRTELGRSSYAAENDYSTRRTEITPSIEPARSAYHAPEKELENDCIEQSSIEDTYVSRYDEQPETELPKEESGRRHQYMDTFSLKNPNIFGQSGNRSRNAEEEVAATDRSSIFEEEPPVQTPSREEKSDLYSLRSFSEGAKTIADTPIETPESIVVEPKVEDAAAPIPSRYDRGSSLGGLNASMSSRLSSASAVGRDTPAAEEKPVVKKPRLHKPYVRVPLNYFNCSDNVPDSDADEVEDIKNRIIETLQDYNVSGGMIASVTFGPTVTRYNVVLPRGVSPKKVVSLEQEIAMGLCREGVNVYPNVEDGAVSIEVPNRKRQTVELGCMFIDDAYTKAKSTSLVFAMGKDIANRKVYGDVCKMTHLLVAGSSGSGKSVFLGCLIISLITKYSPDEMRLILIDPKKTEFVLYNGLPHLMVNEIITDCKKAVQSLSWAIGEMERRYSLIEKKSLSGTYVVNIDEYNANLAPGEEKLPKIVIIVDELADLMLNAKKDMEDKIQSLTQKARAAGIHLILATQRPSTDVITGVIKSNLPTRIAFTVATDVDSRVILDQTGAQKLLGKGDMVYTASGINTPVRVQSPFISSSDSQKVVNFIKENNEAYFDESASTFINNTRTAAGGEGGDASGGDVEPVYLDALKLVIQTQTASISMLQRKCSIGFNKAGKIIEWMEMMEFISPYEGAKARRVLITREKFIELYGEW